MKPEDYASLPAAPIWRRIAALSYDMLLILAISLAYFGIITALFSVIFTETVTAAEAEYQVTYPSYMAIPVFVGWGLSIFGFYGLFWKRNGQTLGMQAWRLRVQKADGYKIDWKTSAKRFIPAVVIIALFLLFRYVNVELHWGFLLIGAALCYATVPFDAGRSIMDRLSNTHTVIVPKNQRTGQNSGGIF